MRTWLVCGWVGFYPSRYINEHLQHHAPDAYQASSSFQGHFNI